MGHLARGWQLAEKVFGKHLADRLRNGRPIDICASNGQIYRIQQGKPLINLTKKETYCVHPVDGDYNFPDMAVLYHDYLMLMPSRLEAVVGGPFDGHRSALNPRMLEDTHTAIHDVLGRARANLPIQYYQPPFMVLMDAFEGAREQSNGRLFELFGQLPDFARLPALTAARKFIEAYNNGGITLTLGERDIDDEAGEIGEETEDGEEASSGGD